MKDVIIIGAGPAGSVLAYDLAVQGLDVLVLEKSALPRYKACGGGVTLKTVYSLPFDVSETYDLDAQGAYVSYRGNMLLRYEIDQCFAKLVMRDRFDYCLIKQATAVGAKLISDISINNICDKGNEVVVVTSKGDYRGRLLAGADGVYSKVARSVGLITNRELGIAVEAEVTVPPGDLNAQGQYATFDFGAIPHGYGWIFPKSDHLSVGVFHARKGKVENIRRSLDQFILSQQVLRQCNIKKVRGHHIPLGGVLNDLNRGRILLVGDAANLADPLLGEGIYYAVSSAHIAASVITEQFDFREIDLSQYTYNINNKIVAQFQYARSLANIIYRFPRVGSMILSKSILLQIAFLKLIRGDFTFRQMNKIIVHHLVKTLFLSLRKK